MPESESIVGGPTHADADVKGDRRTRVDILTKARQVVLSPLSKVHKRIKIGRRRNRTTSRASSSNPPTCFSFPSSSSSSSASGKGANRAYCFCIAQPQTLESPLFDSRTSDPNDPQFTLDKLTTLIQKNDFYSKDCNPHCDSFTAWSYFLAIVIVAISLRALKNSFKRDELVFSGSNSLIWL